MAEAKRLAREHSPAAVRKLVELMDSEDEHVQLKAANAVLDRAFGRPVQETIVREEPGDVTADLPRPERIALLEAALHAERGAEAEENAAVRATQDAMQREAN